MHFPDWDTVPVPSEQAVHDFLAGVVRGDHEVRSLKSSSGWSKWTKPIYTKLTIFSNTVVKSTVETLEGVFGSVTGMFGAKGGSSSCSQTHPGTSPIVGNRWRMARSWHSVVTVLESCENPWVVHPGGYTASSIRCCVGCILAN